jgi:hypothetical protein
MQFKSISKIKQLNIQARFQFQDNEIPYFAECEMKPVSKKNPRFWRGIFY